MCHEFASWALRISHKGRRETVVTGDDAQGTMGRRKRRGEARVLPSRLHLRANFHRERQRDVWSRGWSRSISRRADFGHHLKGVINHFKPNTKIRPAVLDRLLFCVYLTIIPRARMGY